jgi:hypothetical protein
LRLARPGRETDGHARESASVRRELRFGFAVVLGGALLLLSSACGGGGSSSTAETSDSRPPTCPKAWKVGWQKLANDIRAPVYCPAWLPQPLDGRFKGTAFNGQTVDPDRSYLIKFLWFDSGLPGGIQEVHVNFRGYPGNPRIPSCDNSTIVGGKTVHKPSPCFSDPKGKKRFGSTVATFYTSNQGADQWHLLYAWHYRGSLYSLSEHVAAPYSYKQVVANLDRMMRGLVLIGPKSKQQT